MRYGVPLKDAPGGDGGGRTVPVIIPRWEWRSFGEHFGEAESSLAARSPEQVIETDEVYLLSDAAADVVKVRHGLMDIKRLQQVDDDGLEQWAPVMKIPLPLSAGDFAAVAAALGVQVPAAARGGGAQEAA